MKDISQSILEKINRDHIVPESKLRIFWKNYAAWFLLFLLVLFGAIALSLVLFHIADIDPRFFHYVTGVRALRVLFATAPYAYLMLAGIAVVLSVFAFRQTTRGYRRETIAIVGLLAVVLLALGAIGHISHMSRDVDGFVLERMPRNLRPAMNPRELRWQRPDDGLIGGEVLSVQPTVFFLHSFDGKDWTVWYDEQLDGDGDDDALVPGLSIGVIGERVGENSLRAIATKRLPDERKGRNLQKRLLPEGKEREYDSTEDEKGGNFR